MEEGDELFDGYKRAKRKHGTFKQYRPSVQLTKKDKYTKRSRRKHEDRKNFEDYIGE